MDGGGLVLANDETMKTSFNTKLSVIQSHPYSLYTILVSVHHQCINLVLVMSVVYNFLGL